MESISLRSSLRLTSCLTGLHGLGLSSFAYIEIKNRSTSLVESKPVKLVVSCTEIILLMKMK